MYLPDCPRIAWNEKRFVTEQSPDADHVVRLNFGMADFLARKCHPYFDGLRTGKLDMDYYMMLTCGAYFAADEHLPDDIAAACFSTGDICEDGYQGGMILATYSVG